MDETSLHDLLERATEPEPPAGQMAHNALRAGLRLRRRRRAEFTAVCAAVVAVACAVALAVTGTTRAGRAAAPAGQETVWVLSNTDGKATVWPVSAATDKPGHPIVVGPRLSRAAQLMSPGPQMAISPDGKTIWVASGDTVMPISTATKRAGRPVTVGHNDGALIYEMVVSPDGKTVYVLYYTNTTLTETLISISTVMNRAGGPISLGTHMGRLQRLSVGAMAITPDGKTLYFLVGSAFQPGYVLPMATATNTPGAPIPIPSQVFDGLVVAPDGRSIYVVGSLDTSPSGMQVTPVATATNSLGKPASVAKAIVPSTHWAMTPNGRTIYLTTDTNHLVIQFSTITDAIEVIDVGAPKALKAIAMSPDGRTAYAVSSLAEGDDVCMGPGFVTPLSTASGSAATAINMECPTGGVAVSPDGSTLWVGVQGGGGLISTASRHAGKRIRLGDANPSQILFTR